LKNKKQ